MKMGMYNYIGPYIEAVTGLQNISYDVCADHKVSPDMTYCPICGTHKDKRIVQLTSSDFPDNWAEDYPKGLFYNYLYSVVHNIKNDKSTYIYLPNRYYDELKIPDLNEDNENPIDFKEVDFNEMVEKFKELYAEEIEYLEKFCEVKIKYGFIAYYN
jgi:hypothetical protein